MADCTYTADIISFLMNFTDTIALLGKENETLLLHTC
jgi:hypothetical protein